MATLILKKINKVYDNSFHAVHDFNLEIKDKEFIVFVGPSGCGKSTTLRMIAGLEDISYGELYIDDKLVNDVSPKDRDIAMVFQNYALYPHMTIYDNMAFALTMRKVGEPILDKSGNQTYVVDQNKIDTLKKRIEELSRVDSTKEKVNELQKEILEEESHPSLPAMKYRKYTREEIDKKVKEAAEILGLTPFLKRKPRQLSGGQRQRVALGRAIVRKPKVFLMDEPLSNLDAKLRVQMRAEIATIHRSVGATTIYVTHDQTEAMTMATRIVIMKDGYVQQIGSPKEVYNNPANIFVATFIGSPSMNIFRVKYQNGKFDFGNGTTISVKNKKDIEKRISDSYENYDPKSPVEIDVGIRPEDIYVKGDTNNENPSDSFEYSCTVSELLGAQLVLYGQIGGQKLIMNAKAKEDIAVGDKVVACFDLNKIHLFNVNTTNKL